MYWKLATLSTTVSAKVCDRKNTLPATFQDVAAQIEMESKV
jgi:hypothetical protein